MFGYRKLLETNSKYNSKILVYSFFGQPRMEIGGLLQSGGIIRGIWKKAIKQVDRFIGKKVESKETPGVKSILVLGLGAGTAVEEIVKKWPQAKIIGIEIDPLVVKIGRRYFKLGQLEKSGNLQIIIGDAVKILFDPRSKEVLRSWIGSDKYDLILIDLYRGKDFVDAVWQKPFLLQIKKIIKPIQDRLEKTDLRSERGGIVVFNHLFWGAHKKRAEGFTKLAGAVFPKITLTRTLANLLIFASYS